MFKLTHEELQRAAKQCALSIKTIFNGVDVLSCYPVPRGGVPAMYLVETALKNLGVVLITFDNPAKCDFILDDIIDSGKTKVHYLQEHPSVPFFALYSKRPEDNDLKPDEWVVFPWETNGEEDSSADDIPTRLLQYIGEDVNRGGLLETPQRFLKAWQFYTRGYNQDPAEVLKVFEDGADKVDEMVLVRSIPVYSQCEHHLAPFFGVAHVGYIPSGKIVGLSKLSRLVDIFARRLQVQERLTNQVADALEEHLGALGVAVVLECRHMCMESRGVCQQGHSTITSAMRGVMKDKPEARAEFLELIR